MGIPHEPIHSIIINIPPRYMKSLIVTVFWPCWEWIARPSLRYLFSSYAANLSTSHSISRRRVIDSAWYQRGLAEFWGEPFTMATDQNVKTFSENSARGQMISTSTGGIATGQGGDRVVIDDPQNPAEAFSDAKRVEANTFFDHTLSTRLNDKTSGVFVIVMQRLHQKDLTGHVLAEGGWIHIRLPGVAEVDERWVFPRSSRVVERKQDELLWPKRENAKQIEKVRTRLGSYGFAGQYQQRPTAIEGGLIKRKWIRFWTTALEPDDAPDEVILLPQGLSQHRQSWDMGVWGQKEDDWTVGLTGARLGSNMFVLDCDKRRLDLAGCIDAVRAMTLRNPKASRKVIENAANGSEVIRKLRNEIPGLIPINWHTSKVARVMAATPFLEAGNVFLPHPREAGWVADAIEEMVTFPFVEHDDFTDALAQLVLDFDRVSTGAGGVGFGRPDE